MVRVQLKKCAKFEYSKNRLTKQIKMQKKLIDNFRSNFEKLERHFDSSGKKLHGCLKNLQKESKK